jgi:hypothetical protein
LQNLFPIKLIRIYENGEAERKNNPSAGPVERYLPEKTVCLNLKIGL